MTLKPGSQLGPYEIMSAAGAGGMGEVYRATDTRLGRTVALKILREPLIGSEEARQRFEREAKTISSLNHPNICTLYDIGHHDGIDYLVMEFLEGQSLSDRLKSGKLDAHEVFDIGIQIAGALSTAHRRGLVHRDLKPGNILLTKDEAKLLDFGLAKMQVAATPTDDTRTTPVTGSHAIVGTLQYMSPEQLEGREADARSDIFALGATLYEMATGKPAFAGDSQASLISSIMKDSPAVLSELAPGIPSSLDRVIRKCLSKDPDLRWQTAADLQDELRWLSTEGIPQQSNRRESHTKLLLTRIALAAMIVIASAITYFWSTAVKERKSAEIATEKARKGQQFLSDVLTEAIPGGFGDKVTVLDILNSARERLVGAFPDDPEIEADIRHSIGLSFSQLDHSDEAEKELKQALHLYTEALGETHDKSMQVIGELRFENAVAGDASGTLEYASLYESATAARYGEKTTEHLTAKLILAMALEMAGQIEKATATAGELYQFFKRERMEDVELGIESQILYAWLLQNSGNLTDALELAKDAQGRVVELLGAQSEYVAEANSCLAGVYIAQGSIDSAKAIYGFKKIPTTFGIEKVFQGKFELTGEPYQLLVFFETWCPFSRLTMKDLARVDRQYRTLGLNISALTAVTRSSTDDGVLPYLDTLGVKFAVVKENGRSWNYFECRGTPSIRLLSDGYLIWANSGLTGRKLPVAMLEGMVEAKE